MSYKKLKAELQGEKGLIKIANNEILEDTKEMARLAFEKVEAENGGSITKEMVANDVDSFLISLLRAETEIYDEKKPLLISKVIPYYYKNYYNNNKNVQPEQREFPEVFEVIQELLELRNLKDDEGDEDEKFIEKIMNIVSPSLDIISFSQKQSAKSRVGKSLQNHLSKIMDIMEIQYEEQICIDNNGTILDYMIPAKQYIKREPSQVMTIECQTTLKDRYRLTIGKITIEHTSKYLATATGMNLITGKDAQDLTVNKVYEIIKDNNITLVVLAPVKVKIINEIRKYIDKINNGTLKRQTITLEQAIMLNELAENKIITFGELLKRNVEVVKKYWSINEA